MDITEARERGSQTARQTTRSTTLGATPHVAAIDAIQAVKNTADTAKATVATGNDRVKALGVAATALNAMNASNKVAEAMASPGKVSVDFTLGTSKSESSSAQTVDQGRGSNVVAAGDVSITATGAGSASDLHVRGSDIRAGGKVALKADDAIVLESSQDTATLESQNKSSGFSVGVSASFGSSTGIAFLASANQAKGNASGQDTVQRNTHVVAGSAASLESGGDTTLAGATVAAPKVDAKVGGDLTIESRQDTSHFESDQKSSGFGISACIPPLCVGASSLSVSGGMQKIESTYQSVTEQSGLRAGDGGFDVTVQGDTTLTGGAITSSESAVRDGVNRFATGETLTTTDIENKAEYKAEGIQLSVTVAGGGPDKKPGEAPAKRSQAFEPTTGGSAGFGEDSQTVASVTTAGISGVAGDASKRTGDAESGIAPIFDKAKVQREIDAQIKVTEEFGKGAATVVAAYAGSKYDELKTTDPAEAAKWAEGGAYRVALHALVGGLVGGVGGAAGAATSQALIDIVGQQIAELDLPIPLKQALAVAAGTAIGAAFGGAAGAATAFDATVNNYLTVADLKKKGLSKKEQQELSLQNNAKIEDACLGGTREACGKAIANAADDIAELKTYKQELQQQVQSAADVATTTALKAQIALVDSQIVSASNAITVGLVAIHHGNLDVGSMSEQELIAMGFAFDVAGAASIKTAVAISESIAATKLATQAEQARNAANARKMAEDLTKNEVNDPRIGTTLPGAKAPITVTAETEVGGVKIFDTNQTARPTNQADAAKPTLIADRVPAGEPNSNMANAHAEVAVIQRAYDLGLTKGADMTIVVRGEAVCTFCTNGGLGLRAMAEASGLKSLKIVDTQANTMYSWKSGDLRLTPTTLHK